MDLLTQAEHRAMDLTVELANLLLGEVIGQGRTAEADSCELAIHIHGIQRSILAQAAARAYPDKYRLLGLELT